MNSLLPPTEVRHLLGRSLSVAGMPEAVTLGMPHLSMNGLSESWLLKDCGNRHWSMLAQAAGMAVPDFRDPAGDPIYAAFLSVSVRDAAFEAAREHDQLIFASRLARISRARYMSVHRIAVGRQPIGEITMTSTFVRRAEHGRNHGMARVEVPALRQMRLDPDAAAGADDLTALRSGDWQSHIGFSRSDAAARDRFIVDPCPGQDFNGADFLYFASYPAFVDRAEWAFFRPRARFATTRRRDIVYCGNIDPGERVVITLLQFRRQPDRLAHWYRLARETDRAIIGEVFTLRGLP